MNKTIKVGIQIYTNNKQEIYITPLLMKSLLKDIKLNVKNVI